MNGTLGYSYLFTIYLQCGDAAQSRTYATEAPHLCAPPQDETFNVKYLFNFNYACVSMCGFVPMRAGT